MIAKALLPAYGGSALVWGTCMVTFQFLLFAGYVASDFILRRLALRRYLWIHLTLLLIAAFLYQPFSAVLKIPSGSPLTAILFTLLAYVGLPFFLLSFSTPVFQRWVGDLSSEGHAWDPYRLFSASNLGSLVALLAYPFLLEPNIALSVQSFSWRYGFVGLLLVLLFLQIRHPSPASLERCVEEPENDAASAERFRMLPIFLLSSAGTALLLAVTNAITFDISSAPLLWVLPLCVYLLSFVVVFKRSPWLGSSVIARMLPWWVAIGLIFYVMGRLHVGIGGVTGVAAHLAILGAGCWLAHARMAQSKPNQLRHLTRYYLAMSAGGLAGSLLVSWVIPWIANEFIEYPIAMILVLVGVSLGQERAAWRRQLIPGVVVTLIVVLVCSVGFQKLDTPAYALAGLSGAMLILSLIRKQPAWLAGVLAGTLIAINPAQSILSKADRTERLRNFYGLYEIYDVKGRRYLTHGITNHGTQALETEKRTEPLSYYHDRGPVGEVLGALPNKPQRIGMIGLGSGALAAYTRSGDHFDVFELDPLNIKIAQTRFTYLQDAEERGTKIQLFEGDGRLLLTDRPDQHYDFLIIDAFSSGAIPMHLLTVEAFKDYVRVLKPKGVALLHISNKNLNLQPLIGSLGHTVGVQPYFKESLTLPDKDRKASSWAMFSRHAPTGHALAESLEWLVLNTPASQLPKPWTDETSNLLSVFK